MQLFLQYGHNSTRPNGSFLSPYGPTELPSKDVHSPVLTLYRALPGPTAIAFPFGRVNRLTILDSNGIGAVEAQISVLGS